MRKEHGFNASVDQYKKKLAGQKNVPKQALDTIAYLIEKKKRENPQLPYTAYYKGKPVSEKKLKRRERERNKQNIRLRSPSPGNDENIEVLPSSGGSPQGSDSDDASVAGTDGLHDDGNRSSPPLHGPALLTAPTWPSSPPLTSTQSHLGVDYPFSPSMTVGSPHHEQQGNNPFDRTQFLSPASSHSSQPPYLPPQIQSTTAYGHYASSTAPPALSSCDGCGSIVLAPSYGSQAQNICQCYSRSSQ